MTAPSLQLSPTDLRVEHLDHPLGITASTPRLSWRLPSGAQRQVSYQIRVGEWDSGRVESDRSLLVPYEGPPLTSGQRVEWSVKVSTEGGESDWSEPSWWEMGLLEPSDWTAGWVEPPHQDPGEHAVWLLRGSILIERPVVRARVYATALGIYELFLNGSRVGDMELTPGFTSYESTLQYQTFDVTEQLTEGKNVLGAVLSGGWVKWTRRYRHLNVAFLAQLAIQDESGRCTQFGTGPDWQVSRGGIRTADLVEGQVTDLRLEPADWSSPRGRAGDWTPVSRGSYGYDRLTSSPAPPVRRVETLRPVRMRRPTSRRQVADFGQNLNGWVRLSDTGPWGTTTTLVHGEALDSTGDVRPTTWPEAGPEDVEPFQRDVVISSGDPREYFEPRHTTHGFRYVRIEDHTDLLARIDLEAVVVHTDMRRTGWFSCSDDRINRLHEAAVWSFRGNACDIPTDCPTRERAGWTGDWQIFVSTAAFLYDVAGFTAKWLRDLASDQLDDGAVWHLAPNPEHLDFYRHFPPGSAGWGDAAVIVPWEIYRTYGDMKLLETQWESMASWVDNAAARARRYRHPDRASERPKPESHEEFLWDTGFHWGEWLEPEDVHSLGASAGKSLARLNHTDHGAVATAYLSHSARLLSQIAILLERLSDAASYSRLADSARAAWQAEFLDSGTGLVTPSSQANHVRALAFGLAPEGLRPKVAAQLVRLIEQAEMHLGTGFLATPALLPVLADTGHLDVAYALLFQDTEPSWLTMIDRGATTIWEHWNGISADGTAHQSLNHYSKGAVVSFLHRYVAGIQLLDEHPAYRRFRIAPRPGGGITDVEATHDSPYGRIDVAWRIAGGEFILDVGVPSGTRAEVVLPSGRTVEAGPGTRRFTEPGSSG